MYGVKLMYGANAMWGFRNAYKYKRCLFFSMSKSRGAWMQVKGL